MPPTLEPAKQSARYASVKWRESLFLRTASLSGGTAVYMVGQMVLLILIARLGSHTLVGAYALATALLNPVFLLSRMGIRSALATEQEDGTSFRTYRDLQYLLCVVTALVTAAIVSLFLREPLVIYVTFAIFFAKLFETLSDLHYGLLLRNGMQHAVAVSLGIRTAAITFLYLISCLIFDAETAILALPISWGIVYFLHDRSLTRELRALESSVPFSGRKLRTLFYIMFPLALAGFFGQLSLSVPRYFIGIGEGAAILGQVAPALMAHVFVSAFAEAVAQSILPSVSKEIAEGRTRDAWSRLVKISISLLPLTLGAVVAMFAIGPWVVALVFGEGYDLAGALIGVVSISWTLRAYGMLFGSAVLGARNFSEMLKINLVSLVAYTVFTFVLGKAAGIEGVVWGIVIGSVCYFTLMVLAARRRLLT